jgi:hypothetical protein
MVTELRQQFIEPFKTYITLSCPACHRLRQVDITNCAFGLLPEGLHDFVKEALQQLEQEGAAVNA